MSDVYVILVNEKPIFATSLIQEHDMKFKELKKEGVNPRVDIRLMDDVAHKLLLKECIKNIMELDNKKGSMTMTDKR